MDEFHVNYLPERILETAGYIMALLRYHHPLKRLYSHERDLLLYGTESPQFRRHYPDIKPPATNNQGRFEGVVTNLLRRYDEHAENAAYREKLDQYFSTQTCPDCQGTRLRPESRVVTIDGQTIINISELSLDDSIDVEKNYPRFNNLKCSCPPILEDLNERVGACWMLAPGI
jgi:excinuclease ABC subunit A